MTGGELRTHRKAAGLTQAELAKRAGIGRHAVSYWECRDRLDPNGCKRCCAPTFCPTS